MIHLPNADARPARVLVAEDDGILSSLIETVLAQAGHLVTVADCPVRALALHRKQPVDLIILDRKFPQQDGLETLRDLRQGGDRVPVLMLTACDEVADRVAGL